MAAGTKDPALLLGSIVLQSFVVHLERSGAGADTGVLSEKVLE